MLPIYYCSALDVGKENDVDIRDKKDTMRRMIIQKP